jgi:hypothetical protein
MAVGKSDCGRFIDLGEASIGNSRIGLDWVAFGIIRRSLFFRFTLNFG